MRNVHFSTLTEAKAFLCWDALPDLVIQLIPVRQVAYYFPPRNDAHFIALFYDKDEKDQRSPLFLLFHEAGHVLQYRDHKSGFDQATEMPSGRERAAFERQAWEYGNTLFKKFIRSRGLSPDLLSDYVRFAEQSVLGYL